MKNTNPAEKNHLVQVQQHYSRDHFRHPDALARYDEIVPGAAERIIRMAEKEMEHRHSTDDQLNKNAIRATYLGITFAFISVLILSGSVIYALYKGFDTVAASIA